jgi:hypothetical protein
MTTLGRTSMMLVLLGGLGRVQILADSRSVPAADDAATPARPIVEYVTVEGQLCLQPKLIKGRPEVADLVAAQKRWLTTNYPGYRLVRNQHLLTLAPELWPPSHENDPPTIQDSIEIQTADGKTISVCFSLELSAPATLGAKE